MISRLLPGEKGELPYNSTEKMSRFTSLYDDYVKEKTLKKYTLEDVQADLRKLCEKRGTFSPDATGVMAVTLLMEGNYTTMLVDLLEQNDVPDAIKLCICKFFISGCYSEQAEIVGKTLTRIANQSLKEWIASEKK